MKHQYDNKDHKLKLYEVIFEADTKPGRVFDISLLLVIVLSIVLVMLESIHAVNDFYGYYLKIGEWVVTIIFTIEYIFRIYVLKKPFAYIFSFYGLVDLLSVLPTYLGLFLTGGSGLLVIRALRLLRIFRILKLSRYTKEAGFILRALRNSRQKLMVFFAAILTIATILGTLMYMIEGEENGFSSIPEGIYWAIVTLTTVGYGDIAPHTDLGKFLSSFVMILGYSIIAVPTGIVAVAFNKTHEEEDTTQVCPDCLHEGHEPHAVFCHKCGSELNPFEKKTPKT